MEQSITELLNSYWADLVGIIPKLIVALIVLGLFIALGRIFYKTLGKRIRNRWQDSIVSTFVSEAVKWGLYLFGLIMAFNVLGFENVAGSIIAGAGISAIIFGFAFKDIGENFLAGFLLAINRPFEIGDIIEVEGNKGTVSHVDLRTTHIRNAEGKDIYIPNAAFIKNALTNYTRDGLLRVTFMLGIAPECDIEQTRSLIYNYLIDTKEILNTPSPNVVVQELGEFTTDIQVQFWIDLFENRKNAELFLGNNIRSKTITDVKHILDNNGIEMPSQVLEHKMYRNNEIRLSQAV